MSDGLPRSPTPDMPTYNGARSFIQLMNGVAYSRYRAMFNALWDQRGNPQNTVAWDDPPNWIDDRLAGNDRELAWTLWRDSAGLINPRYTRGFWYLAGKHGLLALDGQGLIAITERGLEFQSADFAVLAQLEAHEGIIELLQIVADRGPAQASDLLDDFALYCRTFTTFQSDVGIRGLLRERLQYLAERGFIQKRSRTYEITDAGNNYLQATQSLLVSRELPSKQDELVQIARAIRKEVRQDLLEQLGTMAPYKFEQLIKLLLERMGYDDVKVTQASNDKGVDVIGDIQYGISRRREVVQVKRHKGNITRPVLDGLRGSLHRFDAVQATIITTGGFAKGAEIAALEKGAAPITLIDGERLLDLLEDFEIGLKKRSVPYIELDPADLMPFLNEELDEQVESGK